MIRVKNNIAIGDTGFIFNPGTGDSYSVNPIGLEIIKLMKEDLKQEDIQKFLHSKYDIDESSLENNIFDFINMLKHHQLTETNE